MLENKKKSRNSTNIIDISSSENSNTLAVKLRQKLNKRLE
jgi:hypothetical protein